MANVIKLFQLTQVYFQILGIYPTKPNQKYSFDVTSVFVLLLMIVLFISTVTFFLLEAETVEEYLHTFYFSSSDFGFILCFLVNVWKMPNILQLIENYEEFTRKS